MDNRTQIFRFCLTGVFVIGTDFAVYNLLILVLPYAASKGVSFTCGGVVAYLLNKYWTFQQNKQSKSEIIRFIAANGLALVLNVGVNQLMLSISPDHVFLAFCVATVTTSVFVFLLFKFWVFLHFAEEEP